MYHPLQPGIRDSLLLPDWTQWKEKARERGGPVQRRTGGVTAAKGLRYVVSKR